MPFADISQNASVNLSTSEYGTPRLVNIKIVLCLYVKIGRVTCDFQKMYCVYNINIFGIETCIWVSRLDYFCVTEYFRNLSNIRRMDQSRSQSMSHLNSPSISRLTNQSSNLTPSKSSDSMMGKIGSYIFNWWFIKFTFYYDWPNQAFVLSKVALRTWGEMIFDELTICFIFELTN